MSAAWNHGGHARGVQKNGMLLFSIAIFIKPCAAKGSSWAQRRTEFSNHPNKENKDRSTCQPSQNPSVVTLSGLSCPTHLGRRSLAATVSLLDRKNRQHMSWSVDLFWSVAGGASKLSSASVRWSSCSSSAPLLHADSRSPHSHTSTPSARVGK